VFTSGVAATTVETMWKLLCSDGADAFRTSATCGVVIGDPIASQKWASMDAATAAGQVPVTKIRTRGGEGQWLTAVVALSADRDE